MKTYTFSDYYVEITNSDVFTVYNNSDDLLGYISVDDYDRLISDLDNGGDPIMDSWEDGCGHPLSIEGWG